MARTFFINIKKLFARQNQQTLRNVNLERHPELADIFSGKDPEEIIQQIEFLPNMGSISNDAFLFLDEIHQAVPEAIPALRYFYTKLPATHQIDTVINVKKQRKHVKYPLISLPLYLVERLDDIVNSYRLAKT